MTGIILFLGAAALLVWLLSFTERSYLWAASFFMSCPKCGEVMTLVEEQDPGRMLKSIPRRGRTLFRCPKCSEEVQQVRWFFS